MRQRTSQIIFQYWNEVRGDKLAPSRLEIEPSRMGHILPETCILERTEDGACVFRLAGTRICDMLGLELRGARLTDLASPDDTLTLSRMVATVTHQGAVALMTLSAHDGEGASIAMEAVLLPLTHTGNEVTRYLGSICPIDPPTWLGLRPLTPGPLLEHELIWPDGRPHAVLDRGGTQAPFRAAMANARLVRTDRRQFRVLEGGRVDPPFRLNGDVGKS